MPYGCAQRKKGNHMQRDKYIYKALTPEQWAGFQTKAVFTGSPVDLADGYIHLSCASELKATLDKWYADQAQVILLQVEASAVNANLKYEVSRGGTAFPHVYADLPLSAVGKVWVVSSDAGVYRLPTDLNSGI